MNSKAQVAVSMTILVALTLTVLLVIFYYGQKSLDLSNAKLDNEKAVIAVEELTGAAELVQAQGEGSTTRKLVSIPDSVREIKITGNTISIILNDGNTITRSTRANLTGKINNTGGSQFITIKSLSNGFVNLSSSNSK